MRLLQLTPGAGAMFCGNCLRDNALVAELRRQGHDAQMVPLYLPLTLDEPDQSAGTPLFYGGINVFLEQKSALFRIAPAWLNRALSAPALLKWAGRKTGNTRAADLGELTLSMLRGEQGRQVRELNQLIDWISSGSPRPEIVCLSNALLLGMARRIQGRLRLPVICTLQGEDAFLDALPPRHRDLCWQEAAQRAREVDAFIAPSGYFAELMRARLAVPSAKVHVIRNGIDPSFMAGIPGKGGGVPTIGFLARMCPEKGLERLVEAYLLIRRSGQAGAVQLKIGGSCGPAEEPFVRKLQARLREAGVDHDVQFFPNLTREKKRELLGSIDVFSVPAEYGEAFGLYLLEAMSAGVPVVQPATAAFPEIIEVSGAGLLCRSGDVADLAAKLQELLTDQQKARELGQRGRHAVREQFNLQRMAREVADLCRRTLASSAS